MSINADFHVCKISSLKGKHLQDVGMSAIYSKDQFVVKNIMV